MGSTMAGTILISLSAPHAEDPGCSKDFLWCGTSRETGDDVVHSLWSDLLLRGSGSSR